MVRLEKTLRISDFTAVKLVDVGLEFLTKRMLDFMRLKTILKIDPQGCSLMDISKVLDAIEKAFEEELFISQENESWIISKKVSK